MPSPPFVLRNGVQVDDPLAVVLDFLAAHGHLEAGDDSGAASFRELDLRLANRAGARISAVQIEAILERRRAIERALRAIPPGASLAGAAKSVPWTALGQLFDAFAGISGVGLSKMTKALHRKRPALVPMLDSLIQRYLEADDPGTDAAFGERGLAFVRGYKRDLDRNRAAMRALKRELAGRDLALTEVRILDLLIWSAEAAA